MCIVSYFLKTQRRKRTAAKLSERFCAVFSADMFFCKRMKMTISYETYMLLYFQEGKTIIDYDMLVTCSR